MNAIAYPPVRIAIKAGEGDLVQVRYLESERIVQQTLGEFLDSHIHEMTDEEVDALHAYDKVAIESRVMGPYTVEVVR